MTDKLAIASRPVAMRDAFLEKLWVAMAINDKIYFVTADFGSPVLDKIRRDYPARFLNVGIAEQNLINVSCGLALEGYCVFAYAIAPFITMRCYEQIRISIALLSEIRPLNVNLVGIGAGYSYAMSGPTHQCYEDITLMRGLPNIHFYSPSDHLMAEGLVGRCIEETKPKYLRFDAQVLPVLGPVVYEGVTGFTIRQNGSELCIIATGYMVHTAIEISATLKNYEISATIVDLCDLTDFDLNQIAALMAQHSHIVSMEEGFRGRGGLDSMLFEMISRYNIKSRLLNLGIEPAYSFALGTRQELHERAGIGVKIALAKILDFFRVEQGGSGSDR